MTTTERSSKGLVTRLEAHALRWMATRLPKTFTPDYLTAIGFTGALIYFVGYALVPLNRNWLCIASLGLIINWAGDSLDGTVARLRKIERPRYGFYLDNAIDVIAQFLLAAGIALSGLIRTDLCFIALTLFFAMSIMTLLRSRIFGIFDLTYAGLGPTELRIIFIALNTLIIFSPPSTDFLLSGFSFRYPDVLSLLWSFSTGTTFIVVMVRDLVRLNKQEPAGGHYPSEGRSE